MRILLSLVATVLLATSAFAQGARTQERAPGDDYKPRYITHSSLIPGDPMYGRIYAMEVDGKMYPCDFATTDNQGVENFFRLVCGGGGLPPQVRAQGFAQGFVQRGNTRLIQPQRVPTRDFRFEAPPIAPLQPVQPSTPTPAIIPQLEQANPTVPELPVAPGDTGEEPLFTPTSLARVVKPQAIFQTDWVKHVGGHSFPVRVAMVKKDNAWKAYQVNKRTGQLYRPVSLSGRNSALVSWANMVESSHKNIMSPRVLILPSEPPTQQRQNPFNDPRNVIPDRDQTFTVQRYNGGLRTVQEGSNYVLGGCAGGL